VNVRNLFFVLLFVAGRALAQSTLVDPSFAVGAGADGPVNAILLRTDGKILAGGEFHSIAGQTNFNLALLNSNGIPDTTFHTDANDVVWHLTQQPDGKVLVAGEFTTLQGVSCCHLGRLLTNGLVDPSFSGGTNFVDADGIFTIALQPDGKILASSFDDLGYDYRIVRLHPDGSRDDTFDPDKLIFGDTIHALLVRTNGTIWVGGALRYVGLGDPNTWTNVSFVAGCAVLESNGQISTNFTSPFEWYSDVFSFAELTNGNILVGGTFTLTNQPASRQLVELTPQGQWDTNFNSDIFQGDYNTFITSIWLQPDGKIVATGHFYEVGGYWRRHIVRLDAQGRVDPCFDPGMGLLGFDWSQIVVRQPDGALLVGGRFSGSDVNGPAYLTRLLPDGDCDATRVYFKNIPESNYQFVAATTSPGGTNHLQFSTNMMDWADVQTNAGPYLYYDAFTLDSPRGYFRLKKVF
jgi:uncharacterized delta-60 repeat protein